MLAAGLGKMSGSGLGGVVLDILAVALLEMRGGCCTQDLMTAEQSSGSNSQVRVPFRTLYVAHGGSV